MAFPEKCCRWCFSSPKTAAGFQLLVELPSTVFSCARGAPNISHLATRRKQRSQARFCLGSGWVSVWARVWLLCFGIGVVKEFRYAGALAGRDLVWSTLVLAFGFLKNKTSYHPTVLKTLQKKTLQHTPQCTSVVGGLHFSTKPTFSHFPVP